MQAGMPAAGCKLAALGEAKCTWGHAWQRPQEAERRGHLKACGATSQERSSSHHSIPERCICSERLTENLLIWQPCMGECRSRSPLHPLPVPSAHGIPRSPAVSPASTVPGGHTWATKLLVEGVKYSQMKQNAARNGKTIPAFSDNPGLSIAFWIGDPDVPVGSSLQGQ